MKRLLTLFLTIAALFMVVGCKNKEESVSSYRTAANGAIQLESMLEYRNIYFDGIILTWSMGKITSMALVDVSTDTYNVSGMMAVRDTIGFYYHNEFVTTGRYDEDTDEFILLTGFSYIDNQWEKSADNPLWK